MTERAGIFTGPVVMLLSAALFGYFGFMMSWNHHSAITGQFLLFVALLEWTLKGSALAYVAAAVLTVASPTIGNLVFGVAGLAGAILFVVIAGMDHVDKQHMVLSPVLLLIFAAWNGYGSITGLRAVLAVRAERESFGPPAA